MQKYKLAAAAAFLAGVCVFSEFRAQAAAAPFTPLFDGTTLNGWSELTRKGSHYYVENGCIVAPADGANDLFTDKEYSDFVLKLEFKLTPGANNGVGIRTPYDKGQAAYVGNEIQILDDPAPEYADLKYGQNCGSLYRVVAAKKGALKKTGEWNSYEITAKGRHIKIVLNGKTVVDTDVNKVNDPELIAHHPGMFRAKGRISLLGHNSRVDFRNIAIRELPTDETENTVPEGFVQLFDGTSLSGWKGLVMDPPHRAMMSHQELTVAQVGADLDMRSHWKADAGMLVFDGHGQSICTRSDFTNFEMLVDWKIPAKGDSGIYLRGSPQVQIWEANSPGQFKPVDGSGGLYNNQKASRHPSKVADKPVGEWNRFRIIMEGEKVHVFLNNELVVNNVTMENYWERNKPIYPSGQIELQNHGGQLWFKNIYVRPIPAFNESMRPKMTVVKAKAKPSSKSIKVTELPKPAKAHPAPEAPLAPPAPKPMKASKAPKVEKVKEAKPARTHEVYKNIFTGETLDDK